MRRARFASSRSFPASLVSFFGPTIPVIRGRNTLLGTYKAAFLHAEAAAWRGRSVGPTGKIKVTARVLIDWAIEHQQEWFYNSSVEATTIRCRGALACNQMAFQVL